MKNKATAVCKLGQLLLEYLAADKAIGKLPAAPRPPASRNCYTVSEWNKYHKESQEYKIKLQEHADAEKVAKQRVEQSREAIVAYLPTAHTWFLTEDKKFAVALQGSDWPGDKYRVLYKQDPVVEELPKLSIQIIN